MKGECMSSESQIKKRRLSNLLLQPMVQTKIGLYCILTTFLFALIMAVIIYDNLGGIFNLVFQLASGKDEVQVAVANHLSNIQSWLYVCLVAYVVATIGVSIVYTHRLVGPTVAFRNHLDAIERGDYSHRTSLRKNDAFQEVAVRLNEVSVFLEEKYKEMRKS